MEQQKLFPIQLSRFQINYTYPSLKIVIEQTTTAEFLIG